jgi:hypothetical protein
VSTFDEIARKIIVEASLEPLGIIPEFIIDAWLISRYRRILDRMPFGSITVQNDEVIVTDPMETTGTVLVTQGSILVVGTNTVFDISMIGKYIRFGITRGWYEIADVIDATQLTIDVGFADATRVDTGYFIATRYYNLPGGLRWIIDGKNISRSVPLRKLHRQKMDEMFPDRVASPGVPLYWSPVKWNQDLNRRRVEIYPFANTSYRLEFSGYATIDEPDLDTEPAKDIDERAIIEGGLADAFNFRSGKEKTVEMVRAMLDISGRHERLYTEVVDSLVGRDSVDASAPRIRLKIQRYDDYGIRDPLTNAEQEVFNRSPAIG